MYWIVWTEEILPQLVDGLSMFIPWQSHYLIAAVHSYPRIRYQVVQDFLHPQYVHPKFIARGSSSFTHPVELQVSEPGENWCLWRTRQLVIAAAWPQHCCWASGAGLAGKALSNQIDHLGVSINGGTPSYHPFLDGICPYKPSSYGGTPMAMETPICICSTCTNWWFASLTRKNGSRFFIAFLVAISCASFGALCCVSSAAKAGFMPRSFDGKLTAKYVWWVVVVDPQSKLAMEGLRRWDIVIFLNENYQWYVEKWEHSDRPLMATGGLSIFPSWRVVWFIQLHSRSPQTTGLLLLKLWCQHVR